MNYGYFDDANKEYVVTRPDTPRPWSNYLGNTTYGAIITNNAGGYSFYKSSAQGRFMRLRFNSVPLDQPGRYLYLHDRESHDFWSASWQPVGKPLNEYSSVCRHGTAYTRVTSDYRGIETSTLYYVPLDAEHEVWQVAVKNTGLDKRSLRAFSFVEYSCNWNALDDMTNLQYTQYIANLQYVDNMIDQGSNLHIPADPNNFQNKDQVRHTFMALAGAPVVGHDMDRLAFLGDIYRTYSAPKVVVDGASSNSSCVGGNPCGSLSVDLDLAPGETRTFTVLVGIGSAVEKGAPIRARYEVLGTVEAELQALKAYWHGRLRGLEVTTPDASFNSMMNMWAPYNSLITYSWSRAASLVYTGERDGLGFRDTVQDLLGVAHLVPTEGRKRLELMLTGQYAHGGGMPIVKPFAHRPGTHRPVDDHEMRSDDTMWLFNTVPEYVKETGDLAFYSQVLPFADEGEGTVLTHLRRAIEFSLTRSGAHGFPCGLAADWNDVLKMGPKGETVFVALQLRFALREYVDIAGLLKLNTERDWAARELDQLDGRLAQHGWDGQWYARAFGENGDVYGSRTCEEGKIFLNPQVWAIISGVSSGEPAKALLDQVDRWLGTPYGLMLCAPPFTTKTNHKTMLATLYNPGMKENGSVFNHTQGWAVMAACIAGDGDRAWRYYQGLMPAAYNDKAELRQSEPYVVCQTTHGKDSPRFGEGNVPWLSGAAAWNYHSATHHLLGIRPEYHGITIAPCLPSSWEGFKAVRWFRGKEIRIEVKTNGGSTGAKRLELNGAVLPGSFLPIDQLRATNVVSITL